MKKVLLTSAAALLAAASVATVFAADDFYGAVSVDTPTAANVDNFDANVPGLETDKGLVDQTGGDTTYNHMLVEDGQGHSILYIDAESSNDPAMKSDAKAPEAKAPTAKAPEAKALPKTSAVK